MGRNKSRKRRKQQRRNEEEEEKRLSTRYSLPPRPTPSASASEIRNWGELPELALHSILTRLLTSNPDLPDFLSFSSVCRSWKSTSATSPTSFPPLLLLPILSPGNASHRRRWSRPYRCRLQTLLTGRIFQSKIPSETLTLTCLGYSNGCLIFLSSCTPLLLLVDVFTGQLTRIRRPIIEDFSHFCLALLTDENLFLLTSKSLLLSYSPGTDSWSSLPNADPYRCIVSLAFHQGKLFALDSRSRLMVIDLGGGKDKIFIGGWKPMEVAVPMEQPEERDLYRLVECSEELLLLRLNVVFQFPIWYRITVYGLDFERPMWVLKESLGDCCIFLDTVGYCPVACPDPARWGGRTNCVYFAGMGPNNWAVVPLGEDIVSDALVESPQRVFSANFRRWPMPVWVYPNALLRYK